MAGAGGYWGHGDTAVRHLGTARPTATGLSTRAQGLEPLRHVARGHNLALLERSGLPPKGASCGRSAPDRGPRKAFPQPPSANPTAACRHLPPCPGSVPVHRVTAPCTVPL